MEAVLLPQSVLMIILSSYSHLVQSSATLKLPDADPCESRCPGSSKGKKKDRETQYLHQRTLKGCRANNGNINDDVANRFENEKGDK